MEFLEHLKQEYSEEIVDKIINSFEKDRTHCLILNNNRYSIKQLDGINLIKNHKFINNAFYFDNEKLGNDYRFKNGVFYIQDSAAMMPVQLLNIEEGDCVLDLCAAPGGKTIDAAIKLNETGMIISNELNYERAKILSSNVEKLGFSNIFVTNNDFEKVYHRYLNAFDKIILDAPCSGSFMFRKNDLVSQDWNINKVLSCAERQKNLLYIASQMLKPGGRMVYSTCSLSKEENERVIEDFLNKNENFKICKIPLTEDFYSSEIDGAIYLMPFLFDGEGQFICVLEKEGNLIKYKNSIEENKIKTNLNVLFNLQKFTNSLLKNDLIYYYNTFIKLKGLNVLRYGLNVGVLKGKFETPSFQLAHYLKDNIIELNEEQFKKYLAGLELDIDIEDGYHVVSYNNVNLGFIKTKNKRCKNLYPHGLRN